MPWQSLGSQTVRLIVEEAKIPEKPWWWPPFLPWPPPEPILKIIEMIGGGR